MRKTWIDLVIINGRTRYLETPSLNEHDDNHLLKMTLEEWMQYYHTDNWSEGNKYMRMFVIFHHNFQ